MNAKSILLSVALVCAVGVAQAQAPTTREMNLLCWQEFAELVPAKIETVLLPTGTLEPHGVLPNGSDNLAPEAMARDIAERVGALIAPTLNYGVTGSLDAYPGTFSVDAGTYESLLSEIMTGLARNGFKNIVVLNGHGGPQTAILQKVAERVGRQESVRTLVTNWWAIGSDVTFEVFGEDGGHAGNNESAYVQAVTPEHIHPERYSPAMASPRSSSSGWSAYPFPSSIVLYQPGQGYPDFDPEKAETYFRRVNEEMVEVITSTIEKWDQARIFR
jgi:creatinine amidohydrolase